MKTSDQASTPFRRYHFVEAIKDLDPLGTLGLLDPDFKARLSFGFIVQESILVVLVLLYFYGVS